MLEGLSFGWRTAILAVAFAQLLFIAAGLARAMRNRVANRTLALLLVVLAGILTPWMIGFAGFYDRWQWLTFAPFAIPLAVAPLIYLYVHGLVAGRWPERGWLHLLPAMLQFAFLGASFLLPMPLKEAWSERVGNWHSNISGVLTLAGLTAYTLASLALLKHYRTLLAAQRSDDHRFAATWLSRALIATLVLLPVWAAYQIADWIAPLGYRGLMGLYAAIAAFALYLGIEGWRHAGLAFPALADLEPEAGESAPARDWRAIGEDWANRVRAEGWASDPELSLPVLARRLGTNTGHLSRALNAGLGTSFSSFVNGLRSEAVANMIAEGRSDDLLDLALEAGFSSKASFNRAFAARYGMTPSAWRRHVSNRE